MRCITKPLNTENNILTLGKRKRLLSNKIGTTNHAAVAALVTKFPALDTTRTFTNLWPYYIQISFLGALSKLRKAIMWVCPSAYNNSASTGRIFVKFYIWVPLENLDKNSNIIKNWQELLVLYIESHVRLWQYLAEYFLEWEMFNTNLYKK